MSKKILIAEDSVTVAAAYAEALSPLGHEIQIVHDGEQAERLIFADPPDLVIMDVIMPKIDGLQLCRRIRANPELKQLPVILVTVMDRASDRDWGIRQGANEYLVKQPNPRFLVDAVRGYLC